MYMIQTMDTIQTVPQNDLPATSKASSVKTIERRVDKVLTSPALVSPEEYCAKANIDLLDIYKQLGSIALKAELVAKDRDGEPISLGPDNKVRLSAICLILELNKHIKDKSVALSVGVFNDPKLVADADRVLRLRGSVV